MRGLLPKPALAALVIGLLFAASPVSAQQEAQDSPTATRPAQPAPAPQPLSQPGARGQLHPVAVPPVPVPPGPVAPTEIKPAPPTPIAVKKVELRGDDPWDPEWDVLIEENLPPELLTRQVARDVRPFCPRFNLMTDADKRAFWAYFFQALAGAEAGLRPTADVRHPDKSVAIVDPVTHHIARQEGLLQLKYWDSVRYGCDFDWQHDRNLPLHDPDKTILNPRNNLLCGINILRNQLIDLNEPLMTRKSYWGTLHPGSPGYRNFVREMANAPQACGQHSVRHHTRFDQRIDQALDRAFFRRQPAQNQTASTASFQTQP